MALQTCESCGNQWPIDKFPAIDDGDVCEYCLTGADIAKVKKRLEAQTKDIADQLVNATGSVAAMPKVKDLIAEIYKLYGGPTGFAAKFVWIVDQLCERKQVPASAAALMAQIIKLHLNVEANDSESDIRRLTDEQIRREQDLAFMQMLLEASGDPTKMSTINQSMKRLGLKIEETSSDEQLEAIAKTVGVETSI
jgi:hypothetical protein